MMACWELSDSEYWTGERMMDTVDVGMRHFVFYMEVVLFSRACFYCRLGETKEPVDVLKTQ